jgi:hypothetical protein
MTIPWEYKNKPGQWDRGEIENIKEGNNMTR